MNPRFYGFSLMVFFMICPESWAEPPSQQVVKKAIQKSILLLERTTEEFTVHRDCFSCHHQALPVLVLSMAREKGLPIREEVLAHQVQHTARFFENNRKKFLEKAGTGGGVDTAGYGLLTLQAGGYPKDGTTDAVIEYLLHRIKDNNHFTCSSDRPPSEISPFTTTFLGLNGLNHYGSTTRQKEVDEAVRRIGGWFQTKRARDTEELVFRLKSLEILKVGETAKASSIRDLLRLQREDGGWPQNDWMESDAYATGSALFTLRQVGGLSSADAAYQRGLKWLVKGQLDDGSWKVESWSKPFQTYFESGFPHGKDQWISTMATSWATMALLQTLGETRTK